MANENETPRRGDRPVEPPLIEGEAEEVKDVEEPIRDAPETFAADPSDQIETPSPEPETSETRSERWNAASLIVAALALVLAGTGILAVTGLIDFGTLAKKEVMEPRLAAVEGASREIGQRIGELTAAINRLHGQQQGPAVNAQQDGALMDQVQRLDAQVAAFTSALEGITASLKSIESRQMAQQADAQTTANLVNELNARVKSEPSASQQAQNSAQSASREVAGALLRVRQAVQEGRPFAQDLQVLQNVVLEAADPDLVQLSMRGVLSIAELARRLGAIADELKTASVDQKPAALPAAGVWESFKSKAASLVSVRRLDEAQTLDQVTRATEFMEEGDLKGAVQVLSSAEAGKPAQIEAWLKDARARLAAEKGSEDLTAKILAQLGSGS